jgi:cytoskeletal protein CcmA (bactofilin family)
MDIPKTPETARIGKSVIIKGELSGDEDLYIDGRVEGTIELGSHSLVVGPEGQVRASVNAKGVTVQGKLEGNIHASERAALTGSAVAVGDIAAQRISIEDGAYFKGNVNLEPNSAKAVAPTGVPEK